MAKGSQEKDAAIKKPSHIGIVKNDSYLAPFEDAIRGRHDHALWKLAQLTRDGKQTLSDFSNGYQYYGLHKSPKGWVFREWAPNATALCLVGDFSNWEEQKRYQAHRIAGTDDWELCLSEEYVKHGQFYKMHVKWDGGEGERIPAWATRVVQDETTKIFSAQVWNPDEPYQWKKKSFHPNKSPLLIYECHVGMAQDAERVGTYREFQENVLPRIVADGYNCIQIMAIQEHPYYGSFGYHVSSFFAPSSRFGTPEELKALIDAAHAVGVAVIMDIVHSHAVKNEVEGLGNLAGDPNQYFYPGDFLLSSSHHAPMFCGSDSSSASANASSCCARSPMIYRHASSWSFSRSSISSPLMQNATSPFSPAFSGRTGVFKSKGARLNSSFFCAVSVTY